jgi:type III pantothenate kinase
VNVLLLDAGNRAIKWAVFGPVAAGLTETPQPLARGQVSWRDQAGGLLDWTQRAGAPLRAHRVQAVHGCAVLDGAHRAQLARALASAGLPPVSWHAAAARHDGPQGALQSGYAEPASLGADRWHALVAAHARVGALAACVACAGTALTVDDLGTGGRHLGGVIAPGLGLMRASLAQSTDQLPGLQGAEAPGAPIDTRGAIGLGTLQACTGLLLQRARALAAATGGPVQVLLGGGDAAALANGLPADAAIAAVELAADLVLEGLWWRTVADPRVAHDLAHLVEHHVEHRGDHPADHPTGHRAGGYGKGSGS